jgi:hypothetical protein
VFRNKIINEMTDENVYDILPIIAKSNNLDLITFIDQVIFRYIMTKIAPGLAGVGEDDWNDFRDSIADIYDQAIDNTNSKKIKKFLKEKKAIY